MVQAEPTTKVRRYRLPGFNEWTVRPSVFLTSVSKQPQAGHGSPAIDQVVTCKFSGGFFIRDA